MLKQKILLRKYRNIFSVLVRFFLLYFLKKLYIMHTPGKVKFWQSRGQRFRPRYSPPRENLETIMVSRFFLIYGKLHKVAFVLNLCWTHGKIAHNYLFHATHFCNFFYIFIISTFYTNALIEKSFFAIRKSTVKKMYFSVHFIFPALVLNFVLNHKFFAIIFKDRDIGCPRSTS